MRAMFSYDFRRVNTNAHKSGHMEFAFAFAKFFKNFYFFPAEKKSRRGVNNDAMWDGHLLFHPCPHCPTKHSSYRSPSKCMIKKTMYGFDHPQLLPAFDCDCWQLFSHESTY